MGQHLRNSDPLVAAELSEIRTHHQRLIPSQRDAFEAQLQATCLWSSAAQATYQGRSSELCWLVNHAVDTDDGELLAASYPMIHHLNAFCVAARSGTSKLPPPHSSVTGSLVRPGA